MSYESVRINLLFSDVMIVNNSKIMTLCILITSKFRLTLFGLGFLGLLRPGGIFSSPLPNFCSRSDNDLKLCGKVVYHEKVPKKFFCSR